MLVYWFFEPFNYFTKLSHLFFPCQFSYLLWYAHELNWTFYSYLQKSYLLAVKDLRKGFRNSGSICGSSDGQQCSSEGSDPWPYNNLDTQISTAKALHIYTLLFKSLLRRASWYYVLFIMSLSWCLYHCIIRNATSSFNANNGSFAVVYSTIHIRVLSNLTSFGLAEIFLKCIKQCLRLQASASWLGLDI